MLRDGVIKLPLLVERDPEVVMGGFVIRVKLDGFTVLGNGFVVLPLVTEGIREVVMGDRVFVIASGEFFRKRGGTCLNECC